ncbi:MAG: hypothetical protein IM600_17380 [Bacteroidetes bacterium]|nr:hypothetical protein [Bacteroidota bacterium]MCA6445204.1 hypothetical protein [Bacteroidota bacterium]
MKNLFTTLIVVLSYTLLSQNVAINATGAAPAASAMLDITSTTSGLLIPRMTTAQRTAIAAPATGLKVYDTTTGTFWYFNGIVWVQLLNTSTGWSTTGNAGTLLGTNFLGTTDNVGFSLRTNNTERIRVLNTGEIGLTGVPAAPTVIGGVLPNCMYYPFEVGNDGNAGLQVALGYYRGSDPTVNPEQLGGWGYVGYNAAGIGNNQYWWRGFSGGWIVVSQRELKRNIISINENNDLESYLINKILNVKPSLYNYNNEEDKMIKGKENHYRPAYRIGLIAEESPDFILDESFSGVDIYGLTTLNIVGTQHSIKEINKLKKIVNISDFGTEQLDADKKSIWVDFTEDFKGQIPVITVSSYNPNVNLSIAEKNDKGFKLLVSESPNTSGKINFDWIAMAKSVVNEYAKSNNISDNLKEKLEVPNSEKTKILNFYSNFKPTIDVKK